MSRRRKGSNRKPKHNERSKNAISQELQTLFFENKSQIMDFRFLTVEISAKAHGEKKLVHQILLDLVDCNYLIEVSRDHYRYNTENPEFVIGKVDLTKKGSAYIITEQYDEDVFVPQGKTMRAFPGDIVKVTLLPRKKLEGQVIEIVERAKTKFVCTLQINKSFAFGVPDNRKMPFDFFIPKKELGEATDGTKVVVEFTNWPEGSQSPEGKIIEILGNPGENNTEMNAILAEFDLPNNFPSSVMKEAEDISDIISEEEISKRRDMRDILTFTIDPADAKDFDDALSFKKLDNGHYEIGVHIADVSHYVRPGTELDKQAYIRGNSVYLADRVIPMLPERLSNIICSLRPEEEKLCYSAIFELDDKGKIYNDWYGRTVIYSDHRFSYEEAQEIIEGKDIDDTFGEPILTMDHIAKVMRSQRMKNGALEIESKETRFRLDDKGHPVEVFVKESKDANKLIEEYMLLANISVAESIGKLKEPSSFVFRVHPEPDPEKIQTLNEFVMRFGYNIKLAANQQLNDKLNELLTRVKNTPENHVVSTMVIRSMAKATYTHKNVGHYGLGFPFYSHFTSPIRRYADLIVHRKLTDFLTNKTVKFDLSLDEVCKHISSTEKNASMAEREASKFMQLLYLEDKIGEEFEGVISGVKEWGIYVELPDSNCEGMVSLKEMADDNYFFDEKQFQVVGRKHKKTYSLGDTVTICVKNIDFRYKNIDFEMIS